MPQEMFNLKVYFSFQQVLGNVLYITLFYFVCMFTVYAVQLCLPPPE